MSEEFDDKTFWLEQAEDLRKRIRQGQSPYLDVEQCLRICRHFTQTAKDDAFVDALLELALSQHPFSEELKLCKAGIMIDRGNLEAAEQQLEQCKLLASSSFEMLSLEAALLLRKGYFEESLEKYLEAVRDGINGSDSYIYADICICLEQLERWEEFMHYALKLLATEHYVLINKERMLSVLQSVNYSEKNLKKINKLIDNRPFDASLWLYKGLFLIKIKDWIESFESFEYASLIDESCVYAQFYQGFVLKQSLGPLRAKPFYEKLVKRSEVPASLLFTCAQHMEEAGDLVLAQEFYYRVLAKDNTHTDALFGLALLLKGKQKWMQSVHYLNAALRSAPNDPRIWKELGITEAAMGNYASAYSAFSTASKLDEYDSDIWRAWVEALGEEENIEEAARISERALLLFPEDSLFYYFSFIFHLKMGKAIKAMEMLKLAVALDYQKHEMIYNYFTDLEVQKNLYKMVQVFRLD